MLILCQDEKQNNNDRAGITTLKEKLRIQDIDRGFIIYFFCDLT